MSNNCSNETSVGFGEIPAFRMLLIQQVIRIICSVLGIPLNFLVVAVILRSRQLWSGRNIFWLAVTFYNLLALLQTSTELSIYHLYTRGDGRHQKLCQIYSTLLGCPYGLLLSGLTLASWDRYLALARQHFYQHYATPKNISLILLTVFIMVTGKMLLIIQNSINCLAINNVLNSLTTGGHTSPYWLGIFPMKCGLRFGWVAVALGFQGLLSIICLIVQIKLYSFVRSCIRYPLSSMRTNNNLTELVEQQVPITNSFSSDRRIRLQTLDNSNHRINQLELRAARILGMGILPFCLVILTLCFSSVVLFILNYQGFDTARMNVIMLTFREFLLLHLIYIPSVFVAQSREFRSAVRRCCRFRQPKPTAQFG